MVRLATAAGDERRYREIQDSGGVRGHTLNQSLERQLSR